MGEFDGFHVDEVDAVGAVLFCASIWGGAMVVGTPKEVRTACLNHLRHRVRRKAARARPSGKRP